MTSSLYLDLCWYVSKVAAWVLNNYFSCPESIFLNAPFVLNFLLYVIHLLFFQDPVDPCPDATGNITQYQISFQTGSSVTIESVNTARCTAGRCSYIFEPPSSPHSSYDSVSVAAENVVGVGAARTCTTQTISELQVLLHQV